MNILSILFIFIFNNKNINIDIISKIHEQLKLPIWHVNCIKCKTDDDCPIPFACCHDAFFPIKDKYCCKNYKNRQYKYAYNYIN